MRERERERELFYMHLSPFTIIYLFFTLWLSFCCFLYFLKRSINASKTGLSLERKELEQSSGVAEQ